MTNHRRWHKIPKYYNFQKTIKKSLSVPCSQDRKNKISFANQGYKNGKWKGDNVGYKGLHQWIAKRKPKPEFCEKCQKVPPYDLANISGQYKRDINDFEWLCRKCHIESDGRILILQTYHKLNTKNIDLNKLQRLYQQNKKLKQMGNYFGISHSSIFRKLKCLQNVRIVKEQ